MPKAAITKPNKERVVGNLTLRDYFAAKAMAAQLGNEKWVAAMHDEAQAQGRGVASIVSESAYNFADAMLARRDA